MERLEAGAADGMQWLSLPRHFRPTMVRGGFAGMVSQSRILPEGVNSQQRRETVRLIGGPDRASFRPNDEELACAHRFAYDLAFRMQERSTEVFSLANEEQRRPHFALYGVGTQADERLRPALFCLPDAL